MMAIRACALPGRALLQRYAKGSGYVDCYVTELPGAVDLAGYVQAFYTTPLFKLERVVLGLVGRRSTDHQARALAAGTLSTFAAWRVEERNDDQLLMCDLTERTRSWLMTAPAHDGAQEKTQLYFGSAVTAITVPATGRESIGPVFQALMGLHKLYSRALLHSACTKLQRLLRKSAKQ